MSRDTTAGREHRPAPRPPAVPDPAGPSGPSGASETVETVETVEVPGGDRNGSNLAQVREHTVELLAQLDRPPRNLRVQAGEVSVDITWADQHPPGTPAAAGAPPLAEAHPPGVNGERAGTPAAEPGGGAGGQYLTSPAVGVFYHAREPGAEPFVAVGSVVRPGQQVGIVEAMKLMIPVEADRGGRVAEVLKGNGEPVEYAEPLFALDAEDAREAD